MVVLWREGMLEVLENWVERYSVVCRLCLEGLPGHAGHAVEKGFAMQRGKIWGIQESSNLEMQIWVWGCSHDLDRGCDDSN